MDFNDDDFDFNADDLSPEEKKELEDDRKRRVNYLKNHPLYRKSCDIRDTVEALIESFPEQAKDAYASVLIESSIMLPPKIAGAISSESWLLCMQNASLIRYHAEYLLTSTSGIAAFIEDADENYVQVLRDDMLEFQTLFKEWMTEINKLEREEYVDEWGLFVRGE